MASHPEDNIYFSIIHIYILGFPNGLFSSVMYA